VERLREVVRLAYCIKQIHNTQSPSVPIQDNFPLAASAHTSNDLPHIPAWNTPPNPHVPEDTPLFIGFSENWPMLQQTLVSYLTAGWPASDIYVVDNTGTMLSNRLGQLTIQNPSSLDYHRLEEIYQVNIISTPTLLSFAQLQNFYIYEALKRNWTHYFWSHMDVVVLSAKDNASEQYQSLYIRAVLDLRDSLNTGNFGIRLYGYDHLALVNVTAFDESGGWDTSIPFYPADCDMYERLNMAGYHNSSPYIGDIFDVAITQGDLIVFYQVGRPGSMSHTALHDHLSNSMAAKNRKGGERNTWQRWQQGGGR
jgi:hypothetical protein